jgi:hypothetical protein
VGLYKTGRLSPISSKSSSSKSSSSSSDRACFRVPFVFFANPFVRVDDLEGVRDTGLEVCHGVVERAVIGALELEGVGVG